MSNRIEIGDIIRTGTYGKDSYRVVSIERGCTCPSYLDEIELDDPPASPPHMHIVGVVVTQNHSFGRTGYLNGYDEETLKNVWYDDELVIEKRAKPIQSTWAD